MKVGRESSEQEPAKPSVPNPKPPSPIVERTIGEHSVRSVLGEDLLCVRGVYDGEETWIAMTPRSTAKAIADLEARVRLLEEALKPFAAFNLDGFRCEVLEVVPSSPDNPARRIEPIWTSHFRRAREALALTNTSERENG